MGKKKQKAKMIKHPKEAVIERSEKNDHVFCVRKKGWLQNHKVKEGWYFWDETGMLGGGPYATEKLANEMLSEYANQLNAVPTGTLDQPQITHSVADPLKLQSCAYNTSLDKDWKQGVAKVKEWGLSDVDWIVGANGKEITGDELNDYRLLEGVNCYMEVRAL